jgi:hypothetical protein
MHLETRKLAVNAAHLSRLALSCCPRFAAAAAALMVAVVCACSISVTAERWVPIEEVKEAALLAWLATKQAQGCAGI